MTPHPYADILRAIADGKEIQVLQAGTWRDTHPESVFSAAQLPKTARLQPEEYRVKPKPVKKYFAYAPDNNEWKEINEYETRIYEGGYLWVIEMEVAGNLVKTPTTPKFHVKLC